MKTYKALYEKVYSLDNLILAWRKARKGKTKKEYVIELQSSRILSEGGSGETASLNPFVKMWNWIKGLLTINTGHAITGNMIKRELAYRKVKFNHISSISYETYGSSEIIRFLTAIKIFNFEVLTSHLPLNLLRFAQSHLFHYFYS